MQVPRVSCVSHDVVRSVPGPRVLFESQAKTDVSARFVGCSLRIVLAPITQFFVPSMCSAVVPDLPNPILLSHAVLPFVDSLSRRQSTVLQCHDLEQDGFCKRNNILRVISVIRCCEQRDDTRTPCVSCDTKSKTSHHSWQIADLGITRVL